MKMKKQTKEIIKLTSEAALAVLLMFLGLAATAFLIFLEPALVTVAVYYTTNSLIPIIVPAWGIYALTWYQSFAVSMILLFFRAVFLSPFKSSK